MPIIHFYLDLHHELLYNRITEYIKIFGGPFFDEYSQNEYNTYGSKFVKNVFDEYKSKCVQHIKPASRTKIYD